MNSHANLSDMFPSVIKPSQAAWWSQISIWSLTDVERVFFTGFPVLVETPWCSETLTFIDLSVLPTQDAVQLIERKVSGTRSLTRK